MPSNSGFNLRLWPSRLRSNSPDWQYRQWGQLRAGLGKGWYLRTGVLIWCAIAGGVYPFLDLLYNMATHGRWFIDRSWLVVVPCAAIVGLLGYRRAWRANENAFSNWHGSESR